MLGLDHELFRKDGLILPMLPWNRTIYHTKLGGWPGNIWRRLGILGPSPCTNIGGQNFQHSSLLRAAFPCLPISPPERAIQLPTEIPTLSEKPAPTTKPPFLPRTTTAKINTTAKLTPTEAASSIVSALLAFDPQKTSPSSLPTTIHGIAHQAGGWSEWLAVKILAALQTVLEAGGKSSLNAAGMRSAYEGACRAVEETEGFVADHPVFCTLVALGVLVALAPYVLEWLGFCAGFGELGPVEGSWAALWQSRYAGMVLRGSLFSYFQRLGMTWKRV